MYDSALKKMAEDLEKAGFLTPVIEPEMMVNRAVECMRKSWEDQVAFVWCVDDVKSMAALDDRWPTSLPADTDEPSWMTDDEARTILRYMHNKHDGEIGINWIVIEHYVSELKHELGEEEISKRQGDTNES
jgi:hypothetical protein